MADYTALGIGLLTASALGYVSGWALKRLLAVIETVAALLFLTFGGAAALGIITIHPERLLYWIGWASERIWGVVDVNALLATAGSWVGAFALGTIIGLTRGSTASVFDGSLAARMAENSEWLEE